MQQCGLRGSVRMNELPDDFDRHCPDMGTAIAGQQRHGARQHLGLVRTASPLLASIASQRVQGRDADARVGVVKHAEQIAQRRRFKVAVKKSTAVIADVGAPVMKPFAYIGKRLDPEPHQLPEGLRRAMRNRKVVDQAAMCFGHGEAEGRCVLRSLTLRPKRIRYLPSAQYRVGEPKA